MEYRKLGNQGLTVSALGLGCMGMSWAYGSTDENESIAVIHEAIDNGINFFDTAEIYGPFENEKLVGKALNKFNQDGRDKIVIATKFGFAIGDDGAIAGTNSTPANVKKVAEESLKRLGLDYIDLFYQHRVDPNVPIEDTVGALADLVKAGKVRYIGLSEASVSTIQRAHKVHPISALQSEYSLWEREVESDIFPALRELGIGFVPYSPLGRGFLTGKYRTPDDFEESDFRRGARQPRFAEENMKRNIALVDAVKELASRKNAAVGQIALAWVLHQGKDIVPIPGTKRKKYLLENIASIDVKLSDEDCEWLTEKFPAGAVSGERYSPELLKMLDK